MLDRIKSAWRRIWAGPQWEQDMDEELRFHIEARTAHLISKGVAEPEARRQARVEFGGLEAHKELCRESSFVRQNIAELRRNLRYALRALRKSPGFTAIGVLSMAFGIGANIATFSLVERLMLHDLPVRDPQGLYVIGGVGQQGFRSSQSYVHLESIRAHRDLFSEILAWSSPWQMELRAGDRLENAPMMPVSGSFFPMLGISAHIGRTITEQDDASGSANVAMLGYAAWQRIFGGDANALQQPVKIGGVPFQLIGVAPEGFYGVELGDPPDLFIPLHAQTNFAKNALTGEGMMWLHTMVRLQPQVPLAAAIDEYGKRSIEAGRERHKAYGRLDKQKPGTLQSGAQGYSEIRNEFSKPLIVLMVLVGVVLLIACANLSTLLFVRGAGRSGEMSLRLALGATQGQLIRQWMTECMVIALAGGVMAVLLARWIVDLLLVFVGEGARQYLRFHASGKMMFFAVALTIGAGLLFGLLPSLRVSKANPGIALKESQSSVAGRRKRGLRWLLAAQIAASLVLVTGAALFARTLWNLSIRRQHE